MYCFGHVYVISALLEGIQILFWSFWSRMGPVALSRLRDILVHYPAILECSKPVIYSSSLVLCVVALPAQCPWCGTQPLRAKDYLWCTGW